MKVLVCGSRHFNDYALLKSTLDEVRRLRGIDCIIEGEARGADTLGRVYAEALGIPVHGYPALWDLHGRRAGPIRNSQMLREGTPDLVVAFLAKDSRGTADMIAKAKAAGVNTLVVDIL